MEHSLELYQSGKLIFYDDGAWLHPMFKLERYLKREDITLQALELRDKIVGRAAALITVYFGIKQIYAVVLSEPAREALDHHRVRYDYEQVVESINCKTEQLLIDELDPRRAYEIIRRRVDSISGHAASK